MTRSGDLKPSTEEGLPPGIAAWLGEVALRRATADAIRSLDAGAVTAVCSTQHAPRIALAVAAYYVDRWRSAALAPGGAQHAAPFLTTFLHGPPVSGVAPLAEQLWALQALGISGKLLRLFALLDVAFVRADSALLDARQDAPCLLEHVVGSDVIAVDARHLGAPARLEAPPGLLQLLGLQPRWEQPRRVLVLAADEEAGAIVVRPLPSPGGTWRMRVGRDETYPAALRAWVRARCNAVRVERPPGDALSLILQRGERDADAPDAGNPTHYNTAPNPGAASGLRERTAVPYERASEPVRDPDGAAPPRAHPGPDTADGRERIERRLARSLARFFGTPAERPDETAPGAEVDAVDDPVCVLELQEADPGLHVQVGPLPWLPSSVRRLTFRGPQGPVVALASNLRSRRWAVRLPFSSGRYEVSADGPVSPAHAARLSALAFDGPCQNAVTVFELAADGVATRVSEVALAPGGSYLFLIPPGHAALPAPLGQHRALPDGWRLARVEIPVVPTSSLTAALTPLGFSIAAPRAVMRWTALPPHAYRQNGRGENYPCFLADDTPRVRVTPPAGREAGAAWLALYGPGGTQVFTLPEGRPQIVAFDLLAPGRYMAELATVVPGVEALRLPFEVLATAAPRERGRVAVTLGGDSWTAPAKVPPRDLGAVNAAEVSLHGPPLWPVEFGWSGLTGSIRLATELDGEGRLDATGIWEATREARAHDPVGHLSIDCGDLGRVTLAHRREMSGARLYAQLSETTTTRREVCDAAIATRDAAMLAEHWFDPILRVLGYRLGPSMRGETDPAAGVAFWSVLGVGGDEGRPRAVRVGLLALAPGSSALPSTGADPRRALARDRCEREGLSFVVLSDGWCWTRLAPHRDVRGRTYDLRWFADPARADDAEDFLERFAAQPVWASVRG